MGGKHNHYNIGGRSQLNGPTVSEDYSSVLDHVPPTLGADETKTMRMIDGHRWGRVGWNRIDEMRKEPRGGET